MANLTLKPIAAVCATPQLKAPGIIDSIWVVPVCDLLVEGLVNPSETDIDKYGTIATAHTFTAPKGFSLISDIQENTGQYTFDDQGGAGFGNWKTKAKAMGRTLNPKLVGLGNQLKFQPLIALVKLKSGKVAQLGSSEFPAYLSMNFDSKTNQDTSVWGVEINIEATQPMIWFYDYPTLAITLIS